MDKYNFTLDISSKNAVSKIIEMIKPNSSVLEFGPSHGRITKYLKESLNCSVDIVEIDSESGKDAAKYANISLIGQDNGDINKNIWIKELEGNNYDYIIFADVLEHLYCPTEVLKASIKFLKDDGCILISIPNIANNAILLNLYFNKFNYTDIGLLDDTHIRFFTVNELEKIYNNLGLEIVEFDTIDIPIFQNEQSSFFDERYWIIEPLFHTREFANAYQFVFKLKKSGFLCSSEEIVTISKEKYTLSKAIVYYDSGKGFNCDDKVSFEVNVLKPYKIYVNISKDVKSLKFYPAMNIPCSVRILDIKSDAEIENIIPLNATVYSNNYHDNIDFLTLDAAYEIKGDFSNASFIEIYVQVSIISWIDVIQKLNEKLNKCSIEITDKNNELKKYKMLNDELRENIETLKEYKDFFLEIKNSNTWKITKPIREMIDCIKEMVNQNKNIRLFKKCLINLKENGIKNTLIKINNRIYRKRLHYMHVKKQNTKRFENVSNCELKVSVIVPNFNHEKYLKKRLDSIYSQTYKNIEVILLDDCSQDGSPNILEYYASKYANNTIYVPNKTNSGGVFRQWKKGIQLASGDLCWIAESDDFADLNFLETLVPFFSDDSVMLAYSHMVFWQENEPAIFTYEDYLSPISRKVWGETYIKTASDVVANGLAIKNIIPNASGVVFKKVTNLTLLENEKFLNMKICGDWIFYLSIILGGKIAYSKETNNYFCMHEDSASKVTHSKECYYSEHEMVALTVAELYPDCEQALKQNYQIIKDYYYKAVPNSNKLDFDSLYDYNKVKRMIDSRKISILISIYSFSLGGGEIFPIRLANEIKLMGYPVTIHCFCHDNYSENVKNMLRKDIPIIYGNTKKEFSKHLKTFNFDVINSHHQSIQHMISELYCEAPNALKGIKHVSTMHGMYETLPEEYIKNYLKILDRSVSMWTRVADKNKVPFERVGIYNKSKHTFIPNGVNVPEQLNIYRKDLDISNDAFVLCLASRAIKEKGWIEAIKCTERAREISGKDIHIILLGNGPIYEKLLENELPKFVHLMGFVQDTSQYYAISDMGFLPSYYEGESMPLTIIESLSVGKPVISSIIGETPWLLQSNRGTAGKLFNLLNNSVPIEEVANIIADFAVDKNMYKQAKSVAIVKSKEFNINTVASSYLSIYKMAEALKR